MLKVSSLYFDYQDNTLLQDVNFSLESGQFLHLKGANGVGKTTLLKLIAGLVLPQQGLIQWQGRNIHDNLPRFQKAMCFIGHKSGCHGALTVRENCQFDVHYHEDMDLSASLFTFGLLDTAQQLCSTLSAGQLRRLSLVRLLMRSVPLWILDESFASLDKVGVNVLCQQIVHHIQSGGMVIATAHHALPDLEIEIMEYCINNH